VTDEMEAYLEFVNYGGGLEQRAHFARRHAGV
jgi:hypothetical protein